jgi:hypothetical protein
MGSCLRCVCKSIAARSRPQDPEKWMAVGSSLAKTDYGGGDSGHALKRQNPTLAMGLCALTLASPVGLPQRTSQQHGQARDVRTSPVV